MRRQIYLYEYLRAIDIEEKRGLIANIVFYTIRIPLKYSIISQEVMRYAVEGGTMSYAFMRYNGLQAQHLWMVFYYISIIYYN